LGKARGVVRYLAGLLHSELWTGWRLPAGLSVAISLAVMVALAVASAGHETVKAGPLASVPTVNITHYIGPCGLCTGLDPAYDPDMGYFDVQLSEVFDGTLLWSRSPSQTELFEIGQIDQTSFRFWLRRSKGCGDFILWGRTRDGTLVRLGVFNIPCTPSLAQETVVFTFDPVSGAMVDNRDPVGTCGACPVTIRNSGRGRVRINLENLTATSMQANVRLGFG